MKIIGVQSRVSPFLIAVVLLLQLSPALATGQPDAQQATSQEPVEVTFTKWVTGPASVPDNFGITEGRGLYWKGSAEVIFRAPSSGRYFKGNGARTRP